MWSARQGTTSLLLKFYNESDLAMNDKATDILVTLINRAAAGIDQAVEFSKVQLPEVIEQLLLWKSVSYGIGICVTLLLTVGCALAFKKGLILMRRDDDRVGFVLFLVSLMAGVLFAALLTSYVAAALQLALAPKVWLIGYATSLAGAK